MSKFSAKFMFSVFTICLMLLSPFMVLADGALILPDGNSYKYGEEGRQLVYINYVNGRQDMILSIAPKSQDADQLWIFPVPADPSKVVINNDLLQMPRFGGTEISSDAHDVINATQLAVIATQIYPLVTYPFLFSYGNYSSGLGDVMPVLSGNKMVSNTAEDVQVFEHFEKNGVTTELLTSKTANGLKDYFVTKGFKVDPAEIPAFNDYIGKEYCFVASWILAGSTDTLVPIPTPEVESDYLQYVPPRREPLRTVEISFPTDKIYFPLKLTSVYGSTVVPATIRVIGLVTPEIPQDISTYTKVSYYTSNYGTYIPDNFKTSSGDNYEQFDYTQIQIDAPSKLLTSDLWISSISPIKPMLGKFIIATPLLVILSELLINSMLASLFASLIVFRGARTRRFWKYSLIGFANVFSIIGVILVTSFVRTKSIKPEDQPLFDEIKKKGYSINSFKTHDWKKLIFIPLFSIFFIVFVLIGGALLNWIV